MPDRAYTIDEIDDLRNICSEHWMNGVPGKTAIWRGSYNESERVKTVEEMVRTYMIGGVTAEDIRKADEERVKAGGMFRLSHVSTVMS